MQSTVRWLHEEMADCLCGPCFHIMCLNNWLQSQPLHCQVQEAWVKLPDWKWTWNLHMLQVGRLCQRLFKMKYRVCASTVCECVCVFSPSALRAVGSSCFHSAMWCENVSVRKWQCSDLGEWGCVCDTRTYRPQRSSELTEQWSSWLKYCRSGARRSGWGKIQERKGRCGSSRKYQSDFTTLNGTLKTEKHSVEDFDWA